MALVLGQGVGLAARHAGERGLGQRQERRDDHQHGDRDDHGDVAGGQLAEQHGPAHERAHGSAGERAVELLEQLALAACISDWLVGLGVVHAEQVQDAVHEQQGDLVVVAAGVLRRVARPPPPGRSPRRPADRSASRRPTDGRRPVELVAVDRERQHVGGAVAPHVVAVQLGHLVGTDERDRQLARSRQIRSARAPPCQPGPAGDVDGLPGLLVVGRSRPGPGSASDVVEHGSSMRHGGGQLGDESPAARS